MAFLVSNVHAIGCKGRSVLEGMRDVHGFGRLLLLSRIISIGAFPEAIGKFGMRQGGMHLGVMNAKFEEGGKMQNGRPGIQDDRLGAYYLLASY